MDMDKTQDYACEVKERAAQPALAVRTRTAVQGLPQVMGDALGAVMAYLGELGEHPAGPPYTAYYNMDMQDLDVEIGCPRAFHRHPAPIAGQDRLWKGP